MKLYSYITNERGVMKTQGAQKELEIDLRVGDKDNSHTIGVVTVKAVKTDNGYTYELLINNQQISHGTESIDGEVIIKGK